MKHRCCQCLTIAVWYYMPWTTYKTETDNYYCEKHVRRGCSCNIDPDTGLEDQDKLGRLQPCCEYDYDTNGFDIEKEDEEEDHIPPHKKDWQ